jgi:predicted RNA-binding protein YlqC (UPF0109 family)
VLPAFFYTICVLGQFCYNWFPEGLEEKHGKPELFSNQNLLFDMQSDQEFVEMIVKAVVAHPEGVHTDRTVDERGVLITLTVHPEDMGYVIGRQGQTARAIRTLAKVVGAKNNARVNLKIVEPEGSRGPRRFEDRDLSGEETHAQPPRVEAERGFDDIPSIDDLGI